MLNSKITETFFRHYYTDGKLGTAIRYKKEYLLNLPIPQPTAVQNKKMESLVEQMLALHANYSEKNQRMIDVLDKKIKALVYQLYSLTNAEIKLIESM